MTHPAVFKTQLCDEIHLLTLDVCGGMPVVQTVADELQRLAVSEFTPQTKDVYDSRFADQVPHYV